MKILPQKPEKQPMTAQILEVVGIIQLFTVTVAVSDLLYRVIEQPWNIIIALCAGISASLFAFVVARIIKDLHVIRTNTNGYETDYERKDFLLLVHAMKQMNRNMERIQEMLYTIHPEAFENREECEESDEMEADNDLFMIDKESDNQI